MYRDMDRGGLTAPDMMGSPRGNTRMGWKASAHVVRLARPAPPWSQDRDVAARKGGIPCWDSPLSWPGLVSCRDGNRGTRNCGAHALPPEESPSDSREGRGATRGRGRNWHHSGGEVRRPIRPVPQGAGRSPERVIHEPSNRYRGESRTAAETMTALRTCRNGWPIVASPPGNGTCQRITLAWD